MMRKFLRRLRGASGPPGGLDCAEVAELVQSYLDSEMDDETARRVSAHLDACRRCGLEASVYRDLKAALARHTDPPTDSVDRLRHFGHQLAAGEIDTEPDQPGS